MDNRITGQDGCYFLEATTAHTGRKASMLYIVSDAVFTTLTITDGRTAVAHNALLTTSDLYGQNLAARTVTQGTTLCAPVGSYYSAITMSSGTALEIKTKSI